MAKVKVIMLVSSFTTIVLFSIPLVAGLFRKLTRKRELRAITRASLQKHGYNFIVPEK